MHYLFTVFKISPENNLVIADSILIDGQFNSKNSYFFNLI